MRLASIHAGTWWAIARAVVCTLVVIYLIAPMFIVLIISFSSAPFLTFPPPGLSLQWYRKLFGHAAWQDSLITSVQIMLPTAAIATALGTAAAVGIARGRFPGASLVSSLLMAPVVVPVIITAAAMFGVFRGFGLYGTLAGLIIAHTVLTIPYVLTTVLGSLHMVDEQLENAALTLGATRWSAFWRVVFPLILPAVLSGFLFAMIISFDELVVSMFISSPTLRPVTVQMWSDIRGDVDPTISAIGTVLFLFSLLVLLGESLLRGRWRQEGPDLARTDGLPPVTSPILELCGVSRSYGTIMAVADLSLQLAKGEFLSLLGPSGSGKTTTLMMIAGLSQPTAGEILIEGRPITPLPPYKRNIGVVFQNYALFPHMTVAKNIAFPLTMRRAPTDEITARVSKVLKLVGLPDYGGRYPRQLSGGQQQRVALARAMVFEPPMLLMDEPLGALDKKLREQMQLEIKRLHRDLGMSIIYVTHDQEEALVMSDRIAVFNHGRLEQVGTPTQLYERPDTRFVAQFIGESNIFPGVAGATADGFSVLEADGLRLRAVATRTLPSGTRAVVSVRPERVDLQVGDPPASAENVLAGCITDVVYMGRSRKYVIRTGAGVEVTSFKQARSDNEPDFKIGATVTLLWRSEDATVLPDKLHD